MKITKVLRHEGTDGEGSALNVVVAGNVAEEGRGGGPDGDRAVTGASSRQRVRIVQRNGRTEVREHQTDVDES